MQSIKEFIMKAILLAILMLGVYLVAGMFKTSDYVPDYPDDYGNCDPRTGCW
jgi:hypothetical protein